MRLEQLDEHGKLSLTKVLAEQVPLYVPDHKTPKKSLTAQRHDCVF
jgi:hypothetical protein